MMTSLQVQTSEERKKYKTCISIGHCTTSNYRDLVRLAILYKSIKLLISGRSVLFISVQLNPFSTPFQSRCERGETSRISIILKILMGINPSLSPLWKSFKPGKSFNFFITSHLWIGLLQNTICDLVPILGFAFKSRIMGYNKGPRLLCAILFISDSNDGDISYSIIFE